MDFKNYFKKTLRLILMMSVVSYTACSGGDEELEIPKEFNLSVTELVFAKVGGKQNFSVKTEDVVKVVSNATWCKVTEGNSSEEDTRSYIVTVEPNNETDDRETTISVMDSKGKAEKRIVIRQKDFVLSTQKMIFDRKGGTQNFSVQLADELQVASADSWCVVKELDSNASNTRNYSVTVEKNINTSDRETTISVKDLKGLSNKSIIVSQSAADGLEVETTIFDNISCDGAEIIVKLKANAYYTVTTDASWIMQNALSRAAMETSELSFIIAPNRKAESREGIITIQLNELKTDVTVKQLPGNGMNANIVDGDAQSVALQLGLGWNLGNQFDAHVNGVSNETCWGNDPVTQTTFNKIAEAGFTSVRIPVTWMGQFGEGPSYAINASWLDRVAEVVGYAQKAGLKAIINMHHDGADSAYWLSIKKAANSSADNESIKNMYKALWTQIAEKFKNVGSSLVFESMNEIHDGGWGWGDNRTDNGKQYKILNEWNQLFVDAVRAVGGENSERYLAVTGYCADPDMTMDHLEIPIDKVSNKLLIAVHYYTPYEYTLNNKYTEWGHTGAANKKDSYGDEDEMKACFNKLKTKYVDNGYPVYLGEVGCVHRSTDRAESFRKYYLEYLCKAARAYGLALLYWDNGATGAGQESSGLLNHATGAYINNAKDVIAVMVKGYFTNNTNYTLNSVYDNAPQ